MLRAGQNPQNAAFGLVLLHGRGAGARDITQFAQALALPDLALIAPEAPGLSWWPTSFLAPQEQMGPYVTAGLEEAEQAVATLMKEGLSRDRIGVLGFSQGGCLALEYLARHGDSLGFGVALSAGLVGTADRGSADPALYGHSDKSLEYATSLTGTQVYMSCHSSDPHIPLKRFEDSVTAISSLGAEVSSRTKPGQGHGIDEQDVAAIRKLLNVAAT